MPGLRDRRAHRREVVQSRRLLLRIHSPLRRSRPEARYENSFLLNIIITDQKHLFEIHSIVLEVQLRFSKTGVRHSTAVLF